MSSTNSCLLLFSFFFFNDTATTEIYTLSLHDALPICGRWPSPHHPRTPRRLSMHRSQHRGEWGVVPHGAFRKDGSHRRVPLPTPHAVILRLQYRISDP